MGFKDFLKKGTGLELVSDESALQAKGEKPAKGGSKKTAAENYGSKYDDKMLKQLETEVSKTIEKLEDVRDKLRVRRGY